VIALEMPSRRKRPSLLTLLVWAPKVGTKHWRVRSSASMPCAQLRRFRERYKRTDYKPGTNRCAPFATCSTASKGLLQQFDRKGRFGIWIRAARGQPTPEITWASVRPVSPRGRPREDAGYSVPRQRADLFRCCRRPRTRHLRSRRPERMVARVADEELGSVEHGR